jgi:hypothetical protein
MALMASLNIDETTRIEASDEHVDTFTGRRVVVLEIDRLTIHFSGFRGNEAVCRALDRLIEPLTELRLRAGARLVDDVVADLEAHPIVAS